MPESHVSKISSPMEVIRKAFMIFHVIMLIAIMLTRFFQDGNNELLAALQ